MLAERLQAGWYRRGWQRAVLLPLAAVFGVVSALRRRAYRDGWLRRYRAPVPVVVIGNLTVGGTGKTPLVRYLAHALHAGGLRPGVVSRGYGGANAAARAVGAEDDPSVAGDEPLLLARDRLYPVWIGRQRPAAVAGLLAQQPCDVVLSDDGLQHYALARDVEIVVVDAVRGFGNGALLPAGPLREPLTRLREADLVAVNGGGADEPFAFACELGRAVNLASGETRALAEFGAAPVHAVAGIGHPQRFFAQLEACGLTLRAHAFRDHHPFAPAELDFGDDLPVLMTEKDAVKCRAFARPHMWYVPLEVRDPDGRLARAVSRAVAQARERLAARGHDAHKVNDRWADT